MKVSGVRVKQQGEKVRANEREAARVGEKPGEPRVVRLSPVGAGFVRSPAKKVVRMAKARTDAKERNRRKRLADEEAENRAINEAGRRALSDLQRPVTRDVALEEVREAYAEIFGRR